MSICVECPGTGDVLEGPHWDSVNNVLYFVDIFARKINRWDPSSNTVQALTVPDSSLGAVVTTDKGRLLFAAGHRLAFIDPKTKAIEEIAELESGTGNRFNDGKCDPEGRFWAGTMGPEPEVPGPDSYCEPEQGALYRVNKDRTVTKQVERVDVSNGLAWTETSMYYIDSVKKSVDVFDYDNSTGNLSNRRIAVDTSAETGVPDGMCIDAEGMVWVAFFDGWKVVRFNPTTGAKLSEVKFPAQKITSCCWGGPDLDKLYVTSVRSFLTDEQLKSQPTAGSVFTVTGLGVKGVKSGTYRE